MSNIDPRTAETFDAIWKLHGASSPPGEAEASQVLETFFATFPLERLSAAEGFDLGSGNGRIAKVIARRVGLLHCIEPSPAGIAAAEAGMRGLKNVRFHLAAADSIPLADGSQDFGYSLGVLHHIPSPEEGLRSCVAKLKRGAPFLLYVYHNVEHQPGWVRAAWRSSDLVRKAVSRLPFRLRVAASNLMAGAIYWPLSRSARFVERLGGNVAHIPLSFYRDQDWATLRADALDRFGTPLEHRFSKPEVEALMTGAGLKDLRFAEGPPFWIATGIKA